ncbi:MAG: hypothetical protein JOZ10_03895 [Acidobacteria bacterium]|nr:hypothetical protein [Acidobacteriota bacterium]MBV9147862.1 hypothetical protein [Acidobacteriota bacterium]MBV9437522.1 hypothetical protein [Acidobacteriota bacterium]
MVSCLACERTPRDLRGSYTGSRDGKSYLIVADDNGGGCGPIEVDGKIWAYAKGTPGPIGPGWHHIKCGEEIEFRVPAGVVYSFDYWGP